MIYVLTAILNGYDNLRPPAIANGGGARFICFTDVPMLPKMDPWEFRPLHQAGIPSRTSRVPKILPHLMLPSDAEYSIWHDGNLQLKREPDGIIRGLLAGKDWAAHRHPARQCIYDEAAVLLREQIGTPVLVEREIARYRGDFYPAGAGLWANGFIVRRHTPEVNALNEAWWCRFDDGCERDQLSFPVVRRAAGLEVETIQADVYDSPFVNFYYHAAWKTHQRNIECHSDRAEVRAKLNRLHQLTRTVSLYPEY